MKKLIVFGFLLCMGVATASGQNSSVQVLGVPFGCTYEEFVSAFREKGFKGKMSSYEVSTGFKTNGIFGTFMTYPCNIEMDASKLSHTVYKIKITFSLSDQYKDIPNIDQCRAIISRMEEKYGKATLIQKLHGGKVVHDIEESSAAIWHLSDNIDVELYYRGFEDCKITYGGAEALNGLAQKEYDQYSRQKAKEMQNQLSGSDF